MNDAWQTFRDTCVNRKSTHGVSDLCCTVDNKGTMICFHGDCCIENCSANWGKALANREKQHDN